MYICVCVSEDEKWEEERKYRSLEDRLIAIYQVSSNSQLKKKKKTKEGEEEETY